MGSKLIFSAPKRSISYLELGRDLLLRHAGLDELQDLGKARSVISWAFVIRAISPSSLAARGPFTNF